MDEARQDVFDYIEMFHNPKRLHRVNERLSPIEFERRHSLRLRVSRRTVAIHVDPAT